MAIFLLYRDAEHKRNDRGYHAALVEANDAEAAPAAARALVRGVPNGLFDDFAVVQVAATPHEDFVATAFEGDAVNARGVTRGGDRP